MRDPIRWLTICIALLVLNLLFLTATVPKQKTHLPLPDEAWQQAAAKQIAEKLQQLTPEQRADEAQIESWVRMALSDLGEQAGPFADHDRIVFLVKKEMEKGADK